MRFLVDEGYEDRILMVYDIYIKYRLVKYGGYGYFYIFINIVFKMLFRGIIENVLDKILIENFK